MQWIIAILAILIGFALLGPLGAVLAFILWLVLRNPKINLTKK